MSYSFSKNNMSYSSYIDINKIFNFSQSLIKEFPKANVYNIPTNNSKDLVVYGTNLSPTVGFPMYNMIVRYMTNIPMLFMDIITGVILSEGSIQFYNASKYYNVPYPLPNGARFIFKQSFTHFESF